MKRFAAPLLAAFTMLAQDHQVPIDNDKVKVIKVTQAPHIKTKLHKHDMNRVMIYLQPGKQAFDYEGKAVTLNWKAGEVLWSPKGGNHIAEIVSNNPVTIIELELKNKGTKEKVKGAAKDPLKVDPKHYKVEFENDQVRVVRVKVGGKESIPMHEHSLERVGIYLTDQDFKVTGADGKVVMSKHKAGDVAFNPVNAHQEENLSEKPLELVMVELK